MNDIGIVNNTDTDDYIDRLTYLLPLHRSFTPLERLLIVIITSAFVSIVGCILLCLICPRSPIRRRYFSKNKLNQEQGYSGNSVKRSLVIVPPLPPSYESIVKAENLVDFDKLSKSPYLYLARKSSNGALSDGDGIQSHEHDYIQSLKGKALRSQSARSSLSIPGALSTLTNTYLLGPFPQINVELGIDIIENFLNIHLTNGEHFFRHPAFDEPHEYMIRVQLLSNKIFKKFYDDRKKRRSSLPLNIWKKQQEKITKHLSRKLDDSLVFDEQMQFQFNRNDLALTSIRFLLFCIDRSGLKDLMFEALMTLNPSMIPKHQQIIEFKNLPQIYFGEVTLGISYLPTSERFTINISKLRYFCKVEKDNKIDSRLTISLFHNNRRFFQKKIPFILNASTAIEYDIKESITENIPIADIYSVYVHIEINLKDDPCMFSTSILLGKYTRYETDWHKMLEYPRQTHQRWYPLLA